MLNAQKMMERYRNGVGNAGTAFEEGVRSTTVDPIERAKAAAPKWANNIQQAIANGSYERGLSKTNKSVWQNNAAAAKGKYTASAQLASVKFGQYAAKAAPILEAIKQEIANMPNVTLEDAKARSAMAIQLMHERLKNL